MGTLADKLKKTTRDANGQLAEQSPEEVQSLASKAGLAAAPMTPQGTLAIGGNEHQAKMAGAPNQKQAALSMSMQPSNDLATATRQGQVRSQATGQEQQAQQKSQDLQALGGVGDRVNDLINSQKAKLASSAPVEVQAADQFNGKDVSAIKPLLAQLRANPSDMNLQLQVNQALGYDVSRQLSPDEVNSLYDNSVDAIAKGANGNIDHDLTVSDLIEGGHMGYDAPTLSHLLNVPEEQLSGMTVAQLKNQINQVQADEFSKSQEANTAQQSTQLGTAERQLAHQAGQEAARVGTRSSEADVQHIEKQIEAGDRVQFGGKEYSVEDLLSDGKISGIITDYMNAAPGSPERAQLERSEPQLMQFIQRNQAVLQDAAEKLSQGSAQFGQIQEQNKQILSKLPSNIIEAVLPGGQQLSASTINPSDIPLLDWAQRNPQQAATLSSASKEDAQALSQLKPAEIEALQIGTPGGKWDQYQADNKKIQDLKQRAQQATNPDEIVNLIFGGSFPGGYSDLQHRYTEDQHRSALGLPSNLDSYKGLVRPDGNIRSPDDLVSNFRNMPGESIQDVLAGKHPQDLLKAPAVTNEATWTPIQQKLSKALSSKMDDGKIDANELASSGLSVDDMLQLDPNSKAFEGHRPDYLAGLVKQAVAEAAAHNPGDLRKQNAELGSLRDKLVDALAPKRFQGSDVVAALGGPMSELTKQADAKEKIEKDAAREAKAAPLRKQLEAAQKRLAQVSTGTGGSNNRAQVQYYQALLDQVNRS